MKRCTSRLWPCAISQRRITPLFAMASRAQHGDQNDQSTSDEQQPKPPESNRGIRRRPRSLRCASCHNRTLPYLNDTAAPKFVCPFGVHSVGWTHRPTLPDQPSNNSPSPTSRLDFGFLPFVISPSLQHSLTPLSPYFPFFPIGSKVTSTIFPFFIPSIS